jgi:hypothetical protein
MGVLTYIAKILERTQSIIQPTFPTNSQAPDPNVLELAALWALKLQSIVFSEESLDSAPQPSSVITNKDFLAEVDRRIQSLGGVLNETRKEIFDDIAILFEGCVLELKQGTCLPVPVSNRDNMPPKEVMNLFYAEIEEAVGINSEMLEGAISQMTHGISQGISSRLNRKVRG